jgi:hypothetical protein
MHSNGPYESQNPCIQMSHIKVKTLYSNEPYEIQNPFYSNEPYESQKPCIHFSSHHDCRALPTLVPIIFASSAHPPGLRMWGKMKWFIM